MEYETIDFKKYLQSRLQRMGITTSYEELKKDFYFYGQINDDFLDFEIGIDYGGFLIQRKNSYENNTK